MLKETQIEDAYLVEKQIQHMAVFKLDDKTYVRHNVFHIIDPERDKLVWKKFEPSMSDYVKVDKIDFALLEKLYVNNELPISNSYCITALVRYENNNYNRIAMKDNDIVTVSWERIIDESIPPFYNPPLKFVEVKDSGLLTDLENTFLDLLQKPFKK